MANEQSKRDTKENKDNKENMKEKFPQIIVGVIAVIAIIFGLFYFNNQNKDENGDQANADQEASENAEAGEEGEVGGAQTEGQPEATPTPAPIGQDQKEYTVQEGDTLWSISERRYGSGYNYVDIIEANKANLSNPDSLAAGTKLVLPDVEAKQATSGNVQGEQAQQQETQEQAQGEEQQQEAQQPDMQTTEYTVQQGDTLAKISEKVYGTQENWQRIAEANSIMNPDHIAVGMKLMIPRK